MKGLQEVLMGCKALVGNDDTDYIGIVSSFVKTTTPKKFEKAFRKWVQDSVANVFDLEQNTNKKCLVLCGGQGTYKTTFLSLLFPSEYLVTGHIDLKHKDSRLMLTDTFVIVLDEFIGGLNEREWTALKIAMNLPKVKERKHYARTVGLYPRVANFCATSQLPSSAFSEQRCLLPFDLDGAIDIEGFKAFDIRKMWGQACSEYEGKREGLKQ